MNSNRLKMLEKFMTEEPEDPFIIYALALEYLADHPQKAMPLFDLLLERHPDYIPTYYQAGNLFVERGEVDKAVRILMKGIEKSGKAGDVKSKQELQSLLDTLT